jgi:predicted short-subunit dehydrogenase-like oxidoreductase (DUF2520 family)
MKVVIIGSGNTATVMGGKIGAAGHSILQVLGRREEPAARLAAELGCGHATRWTEIDRGAELYLVALRDSALEGLGKELSLPGKLVLHTAGAASREVLSGVSERCGVLYPLQSLRREIRPFPEEIPLLIDAGRSEDIAVIGAFARTIARQVERADDGMRLKLHLSATLVNNFTNHLYTLAADYCGKEGIDFSLLLPLIKETAERVGSHAPSEVQTGPAIRGDRNTISRHLTLLDNYKDIRDLYSLFTVKIEDYYRLPEIPIS